MLIGIAYVTVELALAWLSHGIGTLAYEGNCPFVCDGVQSLYLTAGHQK